jgi:hypothetical protein
MSVPRSFNFFTVAGCDCEPGGLWWTEVEINIAEHKWRRRGRKRGLPTGDGPIEHQDQAERELSGQILDLRGYRLSLASSYEMVKLLGKFEPPGTPVFNFAMELRAGKKSDASVEDHLLKQEQKRWIGEPML